MRIRLYDCYGKDIDKALAGGLRVASSKSKGIQTRAYESEGVESEKEQDSDKSWGIQGVLSPNEHQFSWAYLNPRGYSLESNKTQ